MRHELKCDHDQFELILMGKKKFDVRFNDRDFQVGDILILHETYSSAFEMQHYGKPLMYTGQTLNCLVTHIMVGPLVPAWRVGEFPPSGVVIMSISGVFLQTNDDEVAAYKKLLGEK
jgi:hypothetical protein